MYMKPQYNNLSRLILMKKQQMLLQNDMKKWIEREKRKYAIVFYKEPLKSIVPYVDPKLTQK